MDVSIRNIFSKYPLLLYHSSDKKLTKLTMASGLLPQGHAHRAPILAFAEHRTEGTSHLYLVVFFKGLLWLKSLSALSQLQVQAQAPPSSCASLVIPAIWSFLLEFKLLCLNKSRRVITVSLYIDTLYFLANVLQTVNPSSTKIT